ncbi:MAG TPA: ABC transporter permease, partial [Longimicrobiaceae bacterium]
MRFAEGVRGAFDTIRAYPLRAFFTIFGTLTGVAFLVAVITILQGMSSYVETRVIGRFYGHNTVTVRRAPPRDLAASATERRARSRYHRLTLDDARWLEERMRTPGAVSAAWSASTAAASGGRKLSGVTVSGATPGHFYVNGIGIAEGRPFTDHEAERGLPVVVIGRDVADRLFPGASAPGRRVLLAGLPYRVVGVLARQGKLFTVSLDRTAIVPARSPLNGVATPRDVVEVISFKVPRSALLPAAMAEVEGWMRLRKRLRPGEENEFSV